MALKIELMPAAGSAIAKETYTVTLPKDASKTAFLKNFHRCEVTYSKLGDFGEEGMFAMNVSEELLVVLTRDNTTTVLIDERHDT